MGIMRYLFTCLLIYSLCYQANGESPNPSKVSSEKTFTATSKPNQDLPPATAGQDVPAVIIDIKDKPIVPNGNTVPDKNNSSAGGSTEPTSLTVKPTEPSKPTEPTIPAKPITTTKPADSSVSPTTVTPATTPHSSSTAKVITTTAKPPTSTNEPSSSVAPPSPSTKAPPAPNSTEHPGTPASTTPKSRFDGPSFVGGIVLAVGLVAMGFIGFKYYKARTDRNYHTL